jgi:hypothetical protein
MEQSLEEMRRARHQGSNASVDDDPDRAPTGEPYRRRRRMQQQALERDQQRRYCETQKQEQEYVVSLARQKENVLHSKDNESDDDDDDDYWFTDDDDDENAVLESIRQARLEEFKRQQVKRAENMAKGHGQYRTISQDEFLPECTSSDYVCLHFFHDEFERCKVMDFHLQQINCSAALGMQICPHPCHQGALFCRKAQHQDSADAAHFQRWKDGGTTHWV